jgi:hypothetical protein
MKACGCITGPPGSRTRCLEPADHRGPHWKNVEPIMCNCIAFCDGHEEEK